MPKSLKDAQFQGHKEITLVNPNPNSTFTAKASAANALLTLASSWNTRMVMLSRLRFEYAATYSPQLVASCSNSSNNKEDQFHLQIIQIKLDKLPSVHTSSI